MDIYLGIAFYRSKIVKIARKCDKMAMAWVWSGMVAASVLYGILNDTIGAVGSAAMEGAAAAVELCLGMAGVMCLWMDSAACSGRFWGGCCPTQPVTRTRWPPCQATCPPTCWAWETPPRLWA